MARVEVYGLGRGRAYRPGEVFDLGGETVVIEIDRERNWLDYPAYRSVPELLFGSRAEHFHWYDARESFLTRLEQGLIKKLDRSTLGLLSWIKRLRLWLILRAEGLRG